MNIFDERGELIRVLCGNPSNNQSEPLTFTVSDFSPDPLGVGGTLILFLNGQVFAVWDVRDKNGNLLPSSYYHLVLNQKYDDGSSSVRARDVFIPSEGQAATVQFSVWPNLAQAGDTILMTAGFASTPANDRSSIKIYAVSGEWVTTIGLSLGTASWNLTNSQGQAVSSGIYLLVLDGINPVIGGQERKTIKVIVLR